MWDGSLNPGLFSLEPMMEEFTLGESLVSKGKGEKGRQEKGKGKGDRDKGKDGKDADPASRKDRPAPKVKAKPVKGDGPEDKVRDANDDLADADEGDTDPNVPSIGWTLIWCDETAFKSTSLAKKKQLECLGLRVKAHKTAERCIRSLDKRSKKHIYTPAASQPRVIALVTTDNYDLVSYLRERPFLARTLVVFGDQAGDVEKRVEEP